MHRHWHRSGDSKLPPDSHETVVLSPVSVSSYIVPEILLVYALAARLISNLPSVDDFLDDIPPADILLGGVPSVNGVSRSAELCSAAPMVSTPDAGPAEWPSMDTLRVGDSKGGGRLFIDGTRWRRVGV